MGILIQFPQPATRTPLGRPPSLDSGAEDVRLLTAYRRDLDRAVTLLVEHVQSGAYDGVALILKPASQAHKSVFVVGGFYRHRLAEAADAAIQLRQVIQLRAREQGSATLSVDMRNSPQQAPNNHQGTLDQGMQASLKDKWNDATARYHRCEKMLRIAFSKRLRASPETTAILLSITQLHIEIVANCLWELVHQPGQATSQSKLETLNAIQQFRTVRAQVSAWMPPAGSEEAYFTANADALSADMMDEGIVLLADVENTLARIVDEISREPTGKQRRAGH